MKRRYNKVIVALAAICALSLPSCDFADGVGSGSENAAYMQPTGTTPVTSLIVDPIDGGQTAITPRLANLAPQATKIVVAYDPKAVTAYNTKNGTRYEALPAEAFKLVDADGKEAQSQIEVEIPAGGFISSIGVELDPLDTEKYPTNVKYMIPLSVVNAENYNILESEATSYITVNRSIITSAAKVLSTGGNFAIGINPVTKSSNPEWTLQISVLYENVYKANQTVINYGPFNDAATFYTRVNGNSGLQVKLAAKDGAETWTQKPVKAGEWLHISYVYRNETVIVYQNGEKIKEFPAGKLIPNETSTVKVGNGAWAGNIFREVRLWNRALSDSEILDYLYLPVPLDTEGLVTYVPFSKETERLDLMAPEGSEPNVTEKMMLQYVENIKLPALGLEIVDIDPEDDVE